MSKRLIKRKEVYWVDLGKTVGSEINKIRPCLVISNDWINSFNNRIIIIPFTSQEVPIIFFHLKINFAGKPATILPEQIRSISRKRILDKAGEISNEIIIEVSQLLKVICELDKDMKQINP